MPEVIVICVLIDADGCPVVDIVVNLCRKHHIPCLILCDTAHAFQKDGVETLVFDEIDTGVSGKTSQKIGIKLRRVSEGAQVICITHSAQIAATAQTHVKISKGEVDGRTETALTMLTGECRVDELSRIMGGIEITESVKATAREMLREYNS